MRCGNCKGSHPAVADVRACYEHAGRNTVQDTRPTPAPSQPSTRKPWYGGNGGRPLPFPSGRYAILWTWDDQPVKLHFFRVDNPDEGRWKGYVFVKEQAGDVEYPVKGARGTAVIDEIAKDPRTAMITYGKEIGKCGACGRTLTDPESRAYGIGPVCRQATSF